jgi:hypothetical protein
MKSSKGKEKPRSGESKTPGSSRNGLSAGTRILAAIDEATEILRCGRVGEQATDDPHLQGAACLARLPARGCQASAGTARSEPGGSCRFLGGKREHLEIVGARQAPTAADRLSLPCGDRVRSFVLATADRAGSCPDGAGRPAPKDDQQSMRGGKVDITE